MTIYSFDDVMRTPKSIHSIELTPGGQTKIPLWKPVSWVGFWYFVVVAFVFFIASRLPVVGVLSQVFAPLVYYVAFPFGIVWLAFKVELDGLMPHVWAIAFLHYLRRPKRVLAGQSVLAAGEKVSYGGRVKIWWDLNAPRLHDGWVTGGHIAAAVPVRFTHAIFHRHQVIVPDQSGILADHEVQGKLKVRS